MKRKILSLALCAALFSAALCTTGVQASGMGEFQKQRTYSGQFYDIKGKWYETYIADLYEYGLAQGTGTNTMSPDEPITVAQIIALTARVNAKYYDGKIREADGEWYEPYINYAIEYGLMTKEAAMQNLNRPATRGESVLMLSRALPDVEFEAMNEVYSFGDVSRDDPCRTAVTLLYCAGVITGCEDGLFHPEQSISRAEVMTVLDRTVNKTLRSGYNGWLQNRPVINDQGSGASEGNQGSGIIGVGVGYGRATFLSKGVSMLTVDMENSSFTLAVYADTQAGGMITMSGVCEVREDTDGVITLSCVVTDRAAQGGASVAVANQAAELNALGFTYDGNRSLQLTEAIKNMTPVTSNLAAVVGTLRIGMTMSVAN